LLLGLELHQIGEPRARHLHSPICQDNGQQLANKEEQGKQRKEKENKNENKK